MLTGRLLTVAKLERKRTVKQNLGRLLTVAKLEQKRTVKKNLGIAYCRKVGTKTER